MGIANAKAKLIAWIPIPLQRLEPCIPSRSDLRLEAALVHVDRSASRVKVVVAATAGCRVTVTDAMGPSVRR